jgi:hypothetical protein
LFEESGLSVDPVIVKVLHMLKIAAFDDSFDFKLFLFLSHDQDVVGRELAYSILVDDLANNQTSFFDVDSRIVDFKLI